METPALPHHIKQVAAKDSTTFSQTDKQPQQPNILCILWGVFCALQGFDLLI